jgi:hypothetical protein
MTSVRALPQCISGGLDCTLAFWDIAAGKAKTVVNTGELLSAGMKSPVD